MRKIPYRVELLETMASFFSFTTPRFASRTDIESFAKQSYVFKTYLKGDDITIQYKDGVAFLIGKVSDESHKLLAREILASFPGITRVYSMLKEHSEVPALNKDEHLISKVKSTLFFHQSVNAAETEVLAKNGIVTLRGKTASTAQKNRTAEYAMDVEGVNKVINELTVTPATLKKEKIREEVETIDDLIDDASVTALVRTILSYHSSTSTLDITVETKGGVVKLEGKVGSWEEKNLADKRVIDVPGVKMVFNNMTIERTAPMIN